MKYIVTLCLNTLILLCIINNLQASTIYVDKNATGANTGSSWSFAYTDLQDAINAAVNGDQIWVAAATYFPTEDQIGNSTPTDPRDLVFKLKDGVKIYGGFAGTEALLEERDAILNPTILSGDIGILGDSTDNSYNVVYGEFLNEGSIIDGFRIRHANGDGTFFATDQGAMLIENSRLIIRNIRFTQNSNAEGVALHSRYSRLRIMRCAFINNTGESIFQSNFSSVDTIFNSVFAANEGIAIVTYDNYIFNCTLYKNTDGIRIENGDTKVYNTIIANHLGEGILDVSSPGDSHDVQNCILTDGLHNLSRYQNVIVKDPRLEDPEMFDFRPKSCSPAINGGQNGLALFQNIDDFLYHDRINALTIDIGAIEFQSIATNMNETIIYVDENAGGSNNGTSWVNAYTTLVDAIEESNQMDGCDRAQIQVAEGTYYVSKTNDPADFLTIDLNVEIYGGFPSGGGVQSSRDWENQPSIISADIGIPGDSTDNSPQLLTFKSLDSTSVFNGFHFNDLDLSVEEAAIQFEDCFYLKVKNIQVAEVNIIDGGSILFALKESSISFENLTMHDNDLLTGASNSSYLFYSEDPRITNPIDFEPGIHDLLFANCTFDNNASTYFMYLVNDSISFNDCTIQNNAFDIVRGSEPKMSFTNCALYDNSCETCFSGSHILFQHSLIANQVETPPSALLIQVSEILTLIGTTIFDHSTNLIDAENNSLPFPTYAEVISRNSILSGLYRVEFSGFNPSTDFSIKNTLTRTQSQFQSNWIEGPPRYVDIENKDFTLRDCSPGKNAGDMSLYTIPTLDLYGHPRAIGPLDIGAIENQTLFAAGLTQAQIYVDSSATGLGNGTNWVDANPNLSDAIFRFSVGDNCLDIDTIFVAKGTYYPEESQDAHLPLSIVGDLVLLGGYQSGGGMRDIENNLSIISGDIGVKGDVSDNAGNLINITLQTNASLIEGFTFIGAQDQSFSGSVVMDMYNCASKFEKCTWRNNGFAPSYIGLIDMIASSPEFVHCQFNENRTTNSIAAASSSLDTILFEKCTFQNNQSIYSTGILLLSPAIITDCDFINNTSQSKGVVSTETGSLTLSRCTFYNNMSTPIGDGIVNGKGSLDINHCAFVNNATLNNGGAISFSKGEIKILNSLFAQNTASQGGAIYVEKDPIPLSTPVTIATIINSTFDQNEASNGPAIYADCQSLHIYNSILWGSAFPLSATSTTFIDFDYNIYPNPITPLPPIVNVGSHNLFSIDPLFLDPTDIDGPDNMMGTIDDGLQPQKGSPAMEGGQNSYANNLINADLAHRPRKYYQHIDIGAYELPCSNVAENLFFSLNATGLGTATTWADASDDIQNILTSFKNEGCLVDSIKLASGSYLTSLDNDRNDVIQLPSGSTMIGGFDVQNNIVVNWDPDIYSTSISGEIGSPLTNDNAYRLLTFEDFLDTTKIIGLSLVGAVDSTGSAIFAPAKDGDKPVLIENVIIEDHKSPAPIFNAEKMWIRNTSFLNNVNILSQRRGILNQGTMILEDATFSNGGLILFPQSKYIQNVENGGITILGIVSLLK